MNLLINMSNLRFGGGISVAKNLMANAIPLRKLDNFVLICPQGCGYESLSAQNVEIIYVPDSFHSSPLVKHQYNHYKFPALVKEKKIDKIVSLGNVAFPAEGVPQLLLIQNAWLLYPESVAWKKIDWKSWIVNKLMVKYIAHHLKYASNYALQTYEMHQRFIKQFKVGRNKVHIIANSFSGSPGSNTTLADYNKPPFQLLVLSKYYAYKNFEILIPVAKILREKNANIEIYLTIDKEESPAAAKFLERVAKEGVDSVIRTIGHVAMDDVGAAIRRYHGMLLPTLLESFSGTYVEAIAYGRPIFTSNMDFAKNICHGAAFYFNPLDAKDIADTLIAAFENPSLISTKIETGKAILDDMGNWHDIARHFSQIIDRFD